jgi:hypothetical protein
MIKAQTLPSGPIRIVVGFPPGGGTDALARVLAQKLQAMWGVNIIIDNKAGAAGVIAADFVAKQPSDGNTLLMAHINSHALATSLQPKLNYNVERDFTPIGLVGVTPNLLICNESQPAKNVKDLINLCKQNEVGPSKKIIHFCGKRCFHQGKDAISNLTRGQLQHVLPCKVSYDLSQQRPKLKSKLTNILKVRGLLRKPFKPRGHQNCPVLLNWRRIRNLAVDPATPESSQ